LRFEVKSLLARALYSRPEAQVYAGDDAFQLTLGRTFLQNQDGILEWDQIRIDVDGNLLSLTNHIENSTESAFTYEGEAKYKRVETQLTFASAKDLYVGFHKIPMCISAIRKGDPASTVTLPISVSLNISHGFEVMPRSITTGYMEAEEVGDGFERSLKLKVPREFKLLKATLTRPIPGASITSDGETHVTVRFSESTPTNTRLESAGVLEFENSTTGARQQMRIPILGYVLQRPKSRRTP
jgi:hypothetical protein